MEVQEIDCEVSDQNFAKLSDEQEITNNEDTGGGKTTTTDAEQDQGTVRNPETHTELEVELATHSEANSLNPEQKNNVALATQNVEDTRNLEQGIQNVEMQTHILEQGAPNLKQDVQPAQNMQQGALPQVTDSLSGACVSQTHKKKRSYEIDTTIKEERDQNEFYENDYKKYWLRVKPAKRMNESTIENVTDHKKQIIKRKKKKVHNKNRTSVETPAARAMRELYSCEKCHVDYTTPGGYLCHVSRKHRSIIKFKCILCSQVFDSNALLLEHKITHEAEDRSFHCSECNQQLDDHCDLLVHQLEHRNQTFHKCLECGQLYLNKSSMESHIYTHFEALVKCQICPQRFRSKNFNKHMEKHSKTRKCVECGKIYPDKGTLEYHMISHTGVKLFQCYYCGRAYANAGQRDIHLRTHTNSRPFECSVCFSKFAQASTLTKHLVTHDTEPKFHCDMCDKKYFLKRSLIDHLSVHNKKQAYPCKLCKKPLSTYAGLRNHMLYKHSTERNYQCKVCDKWFKNGQAVNQHNRKKIHIRNVYAAEKRNKGFT